MPSKPEVHVGIHFVLTTLLLGVTPLLFCILESKPKNREVIFM